MDNQALREELDELLALRSDLDDQDALLRAQPSPFPLNAVSAVQRNLLAAIFKQISNTAVTLVPPFDDSEDPAILRPQISFARGRIERRIKEIQRILPVPSPETQKDVSLTADPRRVFVIHGRNAAAKDALFGFLRAINLDPIEWEEAIAMTGEGAPYIGSVLDHAFSNSQAAIVLLTGDDMARLGTRFLKEDDPVHERNLAPQARPNVLFEAGMAFGRYPNRTIIVGIGTTRPFSDIGGRHIVHLSNAPETRLALADRLRTAGCDVRTNHRTDWLQTGNFDVGIHQPDLVQPPIPIPTATREGMPQAGSPATATRKSDLPNGSFDWDPNCNRLLFSWPGGLSLEIDSLRTDTNRLIVHVINNTDDKLASYRFEISEARSWSETHHKFLPNNLARRLIVSGKDLKAMCKADGGSLLLHVVQDGLSSNLVIGNDTDKKNFLAWQTNEPMDVQIWRLTLAMAYERTFSPQHSNQHGLPPQYLLVRWDSVARTIWMMKDKS